MTTICLVMIVRDEEDAIGRCIESVRGLIDSWVICDTGSSDATRARALEALGDLPGEWHDRPWVDFAHNRSEAMELAKGRADYLLLLDADETVTWAPNLKQNLHADVYRIAHQSADESWTNEKLVSGSMQWKYVGAAHEHLVADRPHDVEFLHDLVIHAHVDMSQRGPKLHRNLGLLLRQLKETPDSPRFRFYLGETYKDLYYLDTPGRDPEMAAGAIEAYRSRLEIPGDPGQALVSRVNMGVLLDDAVDDWPAAMNAFIEAWEHTPERLEPMYQLISRLRRRGQFRTAYALVPTALRIELPPEGMFVKTWMYDWGIHVEHALLAYLLGDHEVALPATESLLANPRFPAEHRPPFEEVRQALTGAT